MSDISNREVGADIQPDVTTPRDDQHVSEPQGVGVGAKGQGADKGGDTNVNVSVGNDAPEPTTPAFTPPAPAEEPSDGGDDGTDDADTE